MTSQVVYRACGGISHRDAAWIQRSTNNWNDCSESTLYKPLALLDLFVGNLWIAIPCMGRKAGAWSKKNTFRSCYWFAVRSQISPSFGSTRNGILIGFQTDRQFESWKGWPYVEAGFVPWQESLDRHSLPQLPDRWDFPQIRPWQSSRSCNLR